MYGLPFGFTEEENTILQGKSKMTEGLDKGRAEEIYIGKIPKRQSEFQLQGCF